MTLGYNCCDHSIIPFVTCRFICLQTETVLPSPVPGKDQLGCDFPKMPDADNPSKPTDAAQTQNGFSLFETRMFVFLVIGQKYVIYLK